MAAGYKAGDKAYIVESNRIVRECTVVRPAGNLIIIRFENGGGIKVNKKKLQRRAYQRLSQSRW